MPSTFQSKPLASPSLLGRLASWPDRLFRDARFLRFVERFPLTRPIARCEARALFDICAGFVYSQTLLASVRLGLFDALRDGPATAQELASRLDLDRGAVDRLLVASTALRLTKRVGADYWALARLGSAVLVSPGLVDMIEHHALVYEDLRDPVALLRGERDTKLAGYWPYSGDGAPDESSEGVSPYSRLMAATLPAIAREILSAAPLKRYSCLMDVGGGDGSFIRLAAKSAPHLRFMLFDLPAVTALAGSKFEAEGLSSRVSIREGDFRQDALPEWADVITLIRVLLDHDDARVAQLLHKARTVLPKNGALIIAEPLADTPGAESVGAYFSFYLLAMGKGRPRRKAELISMLAQAGFPSVREVATCQPLLTRILLASCG